MRLVSFAYLFIVLIICVEAVQAQRMPASPRGQAATQFGGEYQGRRYTGGKWIVVDYGRPILRSRSGIFGEGENYGQKANAGAPVWRAGANRSTRFKTESALSFGDKKLPAGEYSVFIELKSSGWIMIFSNHKAKANPRSSEEGIWGADGYKKEKDVIRVPMQVTPITVSVDQLTYGFLNVSKTGGSLALWWDKTMARVDFSAAG